MIQLLSCETTATAAGPFAKATGSDISLLLNLSGGQLTVDLPSGDRVSTFRHRGAALLFPSEFITSEPYIGGVKYKLSLALYFKEKMLFSLRRRYPFVVSQPPRTRSSLDGRIVPLQQWTEPIDDLL